MSDKNIVNESCQEATLLDSSQVGLEASTESSNSRSSSQGQTKTSDSFLGKLQATTLTSSDGHNSNLPSSIANAFSSFTTFTSNFTLGSSNQANDNVNVNSSNLTIETSSTSTKFSQNTETKEIILARKSALERKNLINLTKLIVKDLISSSLTSGRTIDECQNIVHLNNYFTVIDRVLKHGLKQNLLSNKSTNLWTALEALPKYLKECNLMSESVRSLAHTKTPDGKIKAWIRLAMMQKKLPEYFNELLVRKDVLLKDVYQDYAFMLNDEAHVFAGLIIGVNVIDCNFFVKDDNFDTMDDIIDLSPYLRAATSFDETDPNDSVVPIESKEWLNNLTKVLDQKNYLEERNKMLESSISNLQTKIKFLEEANSKLEMEAKVNEVRIQKLVDGSSANDKQIQNRLITDAIKSLIDDTKANQSNVGDETKKVATSSGEYVPAAPGEVILAQSSEITGEENESDVPCSNEATKVTDESKIDVNKLIENALESYRQQIDDKEKELASLRERASILETSYRGALDKIKSLERDLDIQTSINSDKETTIKIYEKDIREKQNQVESLRASLIDSKKLNSDLNERLNDTSSKLKDRLAIVTSLQASLDKWKLENKALANRLHDKQTTLATLSKDLKKSRDTIEDLKKYNEKINDELKRERESGQNSSETVEVQNEKIFELKKRLAGVENELNDARPFRDTVAQLKKQCQDYEQSLEEVGAQLRESRLEIESLKENSSVYLDSQWINSKQVKECALCQQAFSVTRRKHHCRLCGNVFCQTCSDNKMELASSAKPVRVCDTCHAFLLAKYVKSSS